MNGYIRLNTQQDISISDFTDAVVSENSEAELILELIGSMRRGYSDATHPDEVNFASEAAIRLAELHKFFSEN